VSKPRRRVAVIGATGVAGQQFLVSLDRHPWFEVVALAASERSAGKSYIDAITGPGGHLSWA
jgi:aspartate-semialdehyde dehydrogenase